MMNPASETATDITSPPANSTAGDAQPGAIKELSKGVLRITDSNREAAVGKAEVAASP